MSLLSALTYARVLLTTMSESLPTPAYSCRTRRPWEVTVLSEDSSAGAITTRVWASESIPSVTELTR